MEDQIFSDKIRLSGLIIEKEFLMINTFQNILRESRLNNINEKEIYLQPDFILAFQNVAEIYDFLKYTYLDKIDEKEKDMLIAIMEKYENRDFLCMQDLRVSKDLILKILAKSKFHEVSLDNANSSIMDEW